MAPRAGGGEWKAKSGEGERPCGRAEGAVGAGGEDRGGGKSQRGHKSAGKGGGRCAVAEDSGGGGGEGLCGEGGRIQLSSSAPDFQPSGGYGYGGCDDGLSQFWGWRPLALPALPPLWREYADPDGVPYYHNSKTGLCQWERPPELELPKPVPVPATAAEPASGSTSAGGRADSGPGLGAGAGAGGERCGGRENAGGRRDSGHRDREAEKDDQRRGGDAAGGREGPGGGRGGTKSGQRRRGGGKPEESSAKKEASEFGPPGCNLFVFHLPDDWTDDDLHEYFAPHGNVVSAKVMKELGTGRSRGFGFVSYEDRVSAATAIKKMQGYKILGKRLKVEFKKGEQDGRGEGDDERAEDEEGAGKKSYPDDERLIGYLRAISAKNVVQSLKESESGAVSDPASPDYDEA